MYFLLKKFLFKLDPETAHNFTLQALKFAHAFHLTKTSAIAAHPRTVMGLNFPNPVGLAAGLDKNGDYIDALASLGFGFIEVGTVTPKAQEGNPRPRLFRLEKEEAIINRMGFNNKGVEHLVANLKKIKYRGILGINIGKNRDTALENAVEDYVICFRRVAEYASYVTINISSPNTQSLRDLQHGDLLRTLLKTLKHEQAQLSRYVPLVVKIAPDLSQEELKNTATILLEEKIDGVIATNTTLSRAGVELSVHANEAGGLSGKPVFQKSTEIVRELAKLLENKIPIIACGGIFSAADAVEKFAAGASLVQIYTGLIYRGPKMLKEIGSSSLYTVLRQDLSQ